MDTVKSCSLVVWLPGSECIMSVKLSVKESISSCQNRIALCNKQYQCHKEFLCNKTNWMHQFHKFILSWNTKCWSCSKALYKPVWHIPLLSVQWINSWLWTDELSETCSSSWQNKFVKLVHLVSFITKKFVTMHGHMNSGGGGGGGGGSILYRFHTSICMN